MKKATDLKVQGSFEDFVQEGQNGYRSIVFKIEFRSRRMNRCNSGNFEEVRINTLMNCIVYKIRKFWSYQICNFFLYIKDGTSFRKDPLELKERIILYTFSASVFGKTNELLIAWIFATGSPGNLGIFASRDGATSAKWVLNLDATV